MIREIAEAALNGRGLTKYFDSVRTSSEVAAGKPAPDVYLKVADDMNVDPKNVLYLKMLSMEFWQERTRAWKCAL